MKNEVLLMAVVLAGGAFGAMANYYVSPGATGDGSSAATPCSMATAFTAVKSDQSGSTITIHFLDGTYNKEDAGIAGGFARNGTTIVRGESGDATKVIWIPPANRRITVAQKPSSGANHLVFEDLTFQDCHPNNYQGGAFHNQINSPANGELTVRRCRFIKCDTLNTANKERGGAIKLANGFIYDCYFENCESLGWGGTIFQDDADGSVVSNCTFVSCSGDIGGAIFSRKANTKIFDCVISNCVSKSSDWKSGGVFIQNGTQVHGTTFINCRAEGANTGNGAGGAAMSGSCVVSNCAFIGCSSTYRHGGLYAEGGNTKIMDCRFENCSASAVAGGAVNSKGGLVSGCTFTNCVTAANKGGGLIVTAGGVVTNCSFYGCQSASYGGAAFFELSSGYDLTAVSNRTTKGSGGAFGIDRSPLLNCTIKDNTATTEAGGVYALNDVVISNCVISGNVSIRGGGIFIYAEPGATNILTDAQAKVIDCKIVGNTARIPAGGTGYGQGGGICFIGLLTVDGCTIASNQTYSMDTRYAKAGAGIWCRNGYATPIRLLNSELDGNVGWGTNTVNGASVQQQHDGTYGGNFATSKWVDIPGFDPCISNCYIHGGVASFGTDVYVNNGGVKILDCRIGARGKRAPYNYPGGALVFFEGASEGLIRNSLLVSSGNDVDRALELFTGFTTAGKALVVENCTFHGAKVVNSQNDNVASRFVTFKNCAFSSTSFTSTALGDTKNMTFNSCAQLFASPVLTTTFPGDGKSFYAADFRFNLTGNKDRDYYDLRGSSPLVNKGVNADWMEGATALNGEDRILGGTVDIGCFEYKTCWSGLLLR